MVGAESVFLDMRMLAIAGMGMFVSMLLRCFGLGKVKAKTQNSVDCEAHDHADDDFHANDACHYAPINLFGDEQRQHFIGRGKQHCKEGA